MAKCSTCAAERGGKAGRLPCGWKTVAGAPLCGKCLKSGYVARASALSVAAPLTLSWTEGRGKKARTVARDLGWDELLLRLRCLCRAVRTLKNRAVAELVRLDTLPGCDGQLAPAGELGGTYARLVKQQANAPLSRQWLGAAANTTGVLKRVEAEYRADRGRVFGSGARSLRSYRESAYHVHKDGWHATVERDGQGCATGRLLVTFGVPQLDTSHPSLPEGVREQWQGAVLPAGDVTVVLRGGHGRRRQRADFTRLAEGGAERMELQVYRQRASSGDHRRTGQDRAPAGGAKVEYVTMVKAVLRAPRAERAGGENVLVVRTAKDHFLSCFLGDGEDNAVWVSNGDHVRRSVAAHRDFLARIALDTKHEKRLPRRKRRQIDDAVATRCHKQRNRVTTFVNQEVASIAGLCRRRRVGRVQYHDSERGYFASFPWAAFRARLVDVLSGLGVQVRCLGPAEQEDAAEGGEQGELTCATTASVRTDRPSLKAVVAAAAASAGPAPSRGPRRSRRRESAPPTG